MRVSMPIHARSDQTPRVQMRMSNSSYAKSGRCQETSDQTRRVQMRMSNSSYARSGRCQETKTTDPRGL